MTRLAALGALLLALATPTAVQGEAVAAPAPSRDAARAGTALGITSASLDVVMTGDGAAHVAYLTRVDALTPAVVHVCRIPAGGVTCAETTSRTLPDDDDTTGPWIVSDGTKVVVAVESHDGADASTYAAVSANGTSAYGALTEVADLRATDVELAPGGTRLWVTAEYGPNQVANDYQAFASAPLPGGLVQSGTTFSAPLGSKSVGGHVIGISPEGRPVPFVSGFAPGIASASYYRTFNGVVNDTDPNDMSKWAGLTAYDLGAPWQINGGYDVFSGAGRMWVGYEGLQRDTVLRPFAGGAFGAPVSPDCVSSRFASGTQDAPDVAISRTGELLVTETGSNGSGMFLGFFHGTPDGSRFSAYTELASAPGIRDVETAADPTSDAGGIVVWTADAIYGGQLSFARMPAAAATGCPAPPVTGGSPTVSGKIAGATVELTVPTSCVSAGKKYTVKVAKKKGAGTVVKVVFKASKAKKVTDTKAAFKARLEVKKGTPSGTAIKVKAKITVAPPKGKLVTKSLKTTFAVC